MARIENYKIIIGTAYVMDGMLITAHFLWPDYEWGQSRDSYFNLSNSLTAATWVMSVTCALIAVLMWRLRPNVIASRYASAWFFFLSFDVFSRMSLRLKIWERLSYAAFIIMIGHGVLWQQWTWLRHDRMAARLWGVGWLGCALGSLAIFLDYSVLGVACLLLSGTTLLSSLLVHLAYLNHR